MPRGHAHADVSDIGRIGRPRVLTGPPPTGIAGHVPARPGEQVPVPS